MGKPLLWFDDFVHLGAGSAQRFYLAPDRWLLPKNGRGLLISYMVVGVGTACASAYKPTLQFGQCAMPTDGPGWGANSPFVNLGSPISIAPGTSYGSLSAGAGGTDSVAAPLGYVAFSLAAHDSTDPADWSAIRVRVFVAEAD